MNENDLLFLIIMLPYDIERAKDMCGASHEYDEADKSTMITRRRARRHILALSWHLRSSRLAETVIV